MPHSDEPLNPPVIQFRSLRAGEWIDFRYHVADVHNGRVLIAFDLHGFFDTAEIAEFGKNQAKLWRLAAKKNRERGKSSCKGEESR